MVSLALSRLRLNWHLILLCVVLCFSVFAKAYASSALKPAIQFAAGFLNQPNFTSSDDYSINDDVWISSSDGTVLAANVLTPTQGAGPYPAIVFINSWTMNEYEYTYEAQKYASQGYIVLSYSTRGFGSSEGLIDTSGPKDIEDFSAVIDWLIEHTTVDPENIGTAGVSYGAGICLIGAALDGRIKAVASMSGWGDLKESLYANSSPSLVWGQILDISSGITGRPDPLIHEYYSAMLNQDLDKIPELTQWAKPRSPGQFIDQLNDSGAAIYISKNWGDNLFHANNMMDVYQGLTGPKFLDLVPGTHASNEIFGLLGLAESRVLNNARRWFDYHLKGVDTGIQNERPVQMEIKLTGRIETYNDFPVPDTRMEQLVLHPRGLGIAGELRASNFQTWWSKTDRINSALDTLATTGFPIVSEAIEQFNIPVIAQIPLISRYQGIWFESNRLSEDMKIRGNTHLSLEIEPQQSQVQLVAYLYDMNALGVGTLITHMPYTLPDAIPGKRLSIDFDLVTAAYDVPAGHKLVLAVDTKDIHYGKPPESKFKVEFKFDGKKQSMLSVPVL